VTVRFHSPPVVNGPSGGMEKSFSSFTVEINHFQVPAPPMIKSQTVAEGLAQYRIPVINGYSGAKSPHIIEILGCSMLRFYKVKRMSFCESSQ
jgi:hypothetical protein